MKESLQLLVAPDGADLEHVKVEVSDLKLERPFWKVWDRTRFAATNVTVAPMGYVDLKRAPEHTARKMRIVPGWFQDPILDFLEAVDIRGNDVQGFWIKVRCPSGQRAGVYRGKVRVTWIAGGQARRWEAPFGVRVYGFAIGTLPPVHLSMSFRPGFSCSNWDRLGRIVGTEDYKVQQWIHAHTNCAPYLARKRPGEWADFLADNLMTIDYLYPGPEPQWDELVRLKAEGRLDVFNLKYWRTSGMRGAIARSSGRTRRCRTPS